jgi:spore maturation protein CgeB
MDTPVTLARLAAGERVDYLPEAGLGGFDLVLSFTGGEALVRLERELGARRALPLYGHVDPRAHRPAPRDPRYACDLSYLGTYAADRQPSVTALFAEPARRRPGLRFLLGGSGYDDKFPWSDNIFFLDHVAPPEHAAFFASSRLTLNVTRRDMAQMGWCPSGRLFEAAACGTPILSDVWEGLDHFFEPGREILTAGTTEAALAALDLSDAELAAIARAARERTLCAHTSDHRAGELLDYLARASSRGFEEA